MRTRAGRDCVQVCSSSGNVSDEGRGKIVERARDRRAKETLNAQSAFLGPLIHPGTLCGSSIDSDREIDKETRT